MHEEKVVPLVTLAFKQRIDPYVNGEDKNEGDYTYKDIIRHFSVIPKFYYIERTCSCEGAKSPEYLILSAELLYTLLSMKISAGHGKIIAALVFASLLFMGCGKKAAVNTAPVSRYSGYRDIPGVTMEEIAAVEAFKASGASFVFGMNLSTEAFIGKDGMPGGFSALCAGKFSGLFGIPFELKLYEWTDLWEGLLDHSVDFSGEITVTPDRHDILFMSGTIAERSVKIMRISGSEPLERLGRERPLCFAFLSGTTTPDAIKPYVLDPFNSLFVDEYEDAYMLLKSGKADAFFDESPAEAAFDVYGDVITEDFFPHIYSPVSLATANPALRPVISVIDKYLAAGGAKELAGFYGLGYREYLRHKLFNQYSDEEKRYLLDMHARGGEVPICVEYDNYPTSIWNDQKGEWQGIALDVLNEVSELTGLKFVPINKKNDEWSVLLKLLESGEAAVTTELAHTSDRQGRFLWSDQPYLIDYFALISRNEYPDIGINEVLFSRIGVIRDSVHAHVFNEWFPRHTDARVFGAYPEAVSALENGSIDLLMTNHNILLWMANYLEKPGFKANIVINRPYESYFGFNLNEATLCSVVNKALKLVNIGSIADHWTSLIFDYRGKIARAQVAWLAGFLMLSIVILVLLANMLINNQSESRRLESIIRQRTLDLEAQTTAALVASRTKGEFLAHMSHEIRTPLNAIIGMTLVAQKYAMSEKTRNSLNEIGTASNHLLGILNDVLDMSKIESGKFALIHEPFEIRDALDEVSDIIRMRCMEKQLQFVPSYEGVPDIAFMGDKLRLKQVLINLLGNSVKFTPEKGRIELRCELSMIDDREQFLCFSVHDSGIGMTEEQLLKLFTPFEQADPTIAARFGGTGLGLAISQDLVNQMGGQITVTSSPGEGSVFSFTIGLEATELEKPEVLTPEDFIPELRGKRILLTEDIEINRIIIMELLSDTHVEIDEAGDGQQAVDKFAAREPGYYDFIFMDVQMPVMNGYEATRRIREVERDRGLGKERSVPIFAMTANAYREDIDKAMAAGMNGHVSKPVDVKIVLKVLAQHLNA